MGDTYNYPPPGSTLLLYLPHHRTKIGTILSPHL